MEIFLYRDYIVNLFYCIDVLMQQIVIKKKICNDVIVSVFLIERCFQYNFRIFNVIVCVV